MFNWLSNVFSNSDTNENTHANEPGSSQDWTSAFGVACPHQVDSEASSAFPSNEFTSVTYGDFGTDAWSSSSTDFGSSFD